MKNPCNECLVFPMCKVRFKYWAEKNNLSDPGVISFIAYIKCDSANHYIHRFLNKRIHINNVRERFGLYPLCFKEYHFGDFV
jgi:hypothetical protein